MIFEKIKDIIADEFDVDADDITLETNVREDLDADSLDLVELVIDLEDEFSVEVPDEVLEKIKTVQDIVDYIEEN